MKKSRLLRVKYLPLILVVLIIAIASLFLWRAHLANAIKIKNTDSNNNKTSQPPTTDETKSENLGNYYINVPKLNITAPVIQGVDPTDKKKYDKALEDGVAQMVGTPLPGTGKGNTFIYGHSSADDKGPYSEIFARLDNLKFGDEIDLNLEKQEYKYWVFEKKFIEKTDLSVLEQTDDERLTLMTCWPIGTDDRRLIIVAKRK